MQTLTEIALEKAERGVFTRQEIDCWSPGSPDRQFSLLKRALAAGEVVRIHRGLYALSAKYLREKIDPLALAQRIHGPSYISLETALSRHGWIPEAVYTITSASMDRAREFDTPLGVFSFTRVPQKTFYAAVDRTVNDQGGSFLLATPLKALGDYVYVHRCDWTSARPVVESLRVDESSLAYDSKCGIARQKRESAGDNTANAFLAACCITKVFSSSSRTPLPSSRLAGPIPC